MINFTPRLLLWCAFVLSLNVLTAQHNALNITKDYLQTQLEELQLSDADISDVAISAEYETKHNGLTHLYLQQQWDGIPVNYAIMGAHILPSGEVAHLNHRFVQNLAEKVNTTQAQISMETAILKVIEAFEIETLTPVVLRPQEIMNAHEATFEPFGYALEPIKVRLTFENTTTQHVRLAWQVEYYELSAQNWWNARVDAVTGELIAHHNQVIHCDFGAPDAVCTAEKHQHAQTKTMTAPPVVNNAYNAFPLFVESTNHGERELLILPAEVNASPFGWHDVDGAAGHEYTITRGNNVHAYHDVFDQNQSSGDEPDGGDSLVFDFPYSASNNQPYTQDEAAVTNLFVWNNFMHDIWYQYGFDEPSGNFQVNNYGNGGDDDDHVRAEAMDGSGTNNANFGTGGDGSGARMQMYLWGVGGSGNANAISIDLVVNHPEEVAGNYSMVKANFGGSLPDFDTPIVSQVILAEDSIDVFSDACEDILNGATLGGKIALIDRGGGCQFGTKALRAQNAGAIAVIICNNENGDIFQMPPGIDGGDVDIPVVMMSLDNCNTIKMGLTDSLDVNFSDTGDNLPAGPTGRDSDFDNGIICHEYGHGISIRLTGGPNVGGGCLSNFEQAGEGWSDYFALVLSTDATRTAEEARGIGTYAINEPVTGVGIRTHPYSRDMSVNPHTYKNINGESVPHGVGSVWCAMIWDLYWNLVDVYGFDEDLYFGTGGNNIAMQLVIDGLKLQPCNPDFTESRDAIIEADVINNDGANVCLIWETFARRGLGASAEPGGEEAFDLPILCSNDIQMTKRALAGNVTEGGTITYEISIANGLEEGGTNIVITDVLPEGTTYVEGSSSCGGTVNNGILTIELATATFGEISTCTYDLQINDGEWTKIISSDDLEEGIDVNWTSSSGFGSTIWQEDTTNPNSGNIAAYADNFESVCDQYFTLNEPFEITGESPGISFWHYYDTEETGDGGVVEISDGGGSWIDLGDYMLVNGYNNSIAPAPTPISGRMAFTGQSDGYIQTIIDLSDFVGATASIRFRFGCNGINGGDGWYVDDFQIIDNVITIVNNACMVGDGFDERCDNALSAVFDNTPSTTTVASADFNLQVFPNPANEYLSIHLKDTKNTAAVIHILSVDGRIMQTKNIDTNATQTIDTQSLSTGVYFLKAQTETGILVQKVIIE